MRGSPPSVISKTVQQIIESNNPKYRYAVGRMASLILFRKWGGDRIYDYMISRMIR